MSQEEARQRKPGKREHPLCPGVKSRREVPTPSQHLQGAGSSISLAPQVGNGGARSREKGCVKDSKGVQSGLGIWELDSPGSCQEEPKHTVVEGCSGGGGLRGQAT